MNTSEYIVTGLVCIAIVLKYINSVFKYKSEPVTRSILTNTHQYAQILAQTS